MGSKCRDGLQNRMRFVPPSVAGVAPGLPARKEEMNAADHKAIERRARKAKLPKYMYDTEDARCALRRFLDVFVDMRDTCK